MLPQLLLWTLTLVPAFTNAALWPKDTLVKPIDAKGFRKVMKNNVRPVPSDPVDIMDVDFALGN